ncbi:glutathione synthase/RimK-type ligase-like ATP-grasp enzyme [Bacillus mesophilus]|uniref:YheC/YheD family protein n=1 Tax=Bacillus mesophilus TaxID=1808955 RepID=A0A6M0QCI9_9BACI|nr:glutathione synthase/RimK-type ligase-like ATP-grasp enzyme [Bacillus mesophilus]NEY73429.1 YheC/YheD family protein [Bacillus mesophilus]
MNPQYLGIIIPKSTYDRMPVLTSNDRSMFSIWENTAKRHQLIPCYFRFFDIQPGVETISAFVKEGNEYQRKQIPSPSVIYSRVLDHLPAFRSHIKSLQNDGKTIFNVPNYDVEKYKIHQILKQDPYLKEHLPETEVLTIESLNKMASNYSTLILKKSYGEFGKGAMKLEKIDKENWCLSYKSKKDEPLKRVLFNKKIPSLLKKRVTKKTYIIQELIPLATFQGNPFDMRVAVQRNIQGHFQVSGIMCKVAKNQEFLTNGAQGGTTYTLEEIAAQSHPTIPLGTLQARISDFSIDLCKYLSNYFPHLADLGLDIGVTKEGKPYFIECNFISDYADGIFKNGELINEDWEAVFRTPIEYARYLLEKG